MMNALRGQDAQRLVARALRVGARADLPRSSTILWMKYVLE